MYRTWNGVLRDRKLWDITDIYIYKTTKCMIKPLP